MKRTSLLGVLTVLMAINASQSWAAIRYVNAGATGANNGTSWTDAFTDLQSALAAAQSGDEIWVAAGTYKPTSGTDRNISFVMKEGVGIYGGFAGGETTLAARNWQTHSTILSGDIGALGDNADNSFHVVIGGDQAVLDGFTIMAGNATDKDGGGIYNNGHSPTIANCMISGNSSTGFGGAGMINEYGSATLSNCTFSGNIAKGRGGGLYNFNSSATVTNCTFNDNQAGQGGGIDNTRSSPTITNCTFNGCYVLGTGGGMSIDGGSPTLTNCTFTSNSARDGGGLINSGGSLTVDNCTFSNNSGRYGGGIYNPAGLGTLISSVFTTNSARLGGGLYNTGTVIVSGCTFNGNVGSIGGGGMVGKDARVSNCTFSGNYTENNSAQGGGIREAALVTDCTFNGNSAYHGGGMSSPGPVTNCIFIGNSATSTGGGFLSGGDGTGLVNNCMFIGNSANYGGGMAGMLATNCVFSRNSADRGGGMGTNGGTFINCTFNGNTAATSGGAMYNQSNSTTTLTNSILWDNSASTASQVYIFDSLNLHLDHCDFQGSGGSGASWNSTFGIDGGGNIDTDPLFFNAADPNGIDGIPRTADDGLRLLAGSPSIDAGLAAGAPTTDILGYSRFGAADIGAYEFLPKSGAKAWAIYQ